MHLRLHWDRVDKLNFIGLVVDGEQRAIMLSLCSLDANWNILMDLILEVTILVINIDFNLLLLGEGINETVSVRSLDEILIIHLDYFPIRIL